MPKTRSGYLNRSPRQLARWVTWLSWLSAGLLAAVMLQSFFAVLTASDLLSGRPGAGPSARLARQLLLGTSTIAVVVVLVTGGLFLAWVYRISANAHAMGAEGLRFAPPVTVLLFFIPVVNVLLVPLMMDELWRASISVPQWKEQKRGWMVMTWWLLTLAVVAGGALMIHTGRGKNPSMAEHIFIWQMVYIIVTVPFYFVLPELVNQMSTNLRRQMRVGSRGAKRMEVLEATAATATQA